eukprot:134112_1
MDITERKLVESICFDAIKDENDTKQTNETRSKNSVVKKSNKKDAFEMIIPEQNCTEIGCWTKTYEQCQHCRQFKCEQHLLFIVHLFGPYCIYCYKRKWYIIIGTGICVVICIALFFWMLHMLGVYS